MLDKGRFDQKRAFLRALWRKYRSAFDLWNQYQKIYDTIIRENKEGPVAQ